jgi:hypothetical protein
LELKEKETLIESLKNKFEKILEMHTEEKNEKELALS